MLRTLTGALLAAVVAAAPAAAADAKTAKVQAGSNPPPKELKEPIRQLLGDQTVQLVDKDGPVAEIWFRKEVPSNADAKDIKDGARYRHVQQSTVLGAVKFDQIW